jgi:hypothetical protein
MTMSERPSADLRARLLRAAALTPSTRPRAWARRALLGGLGAMAWCLVAMVALGLRRDWQALPTVSLAETIVTLLAVAGLAMAVGLTRGRAMVGAASESLVLAAWGLPTVLLLLVVAVDPRASSSVLFAGWPATVWHARACDLFTFIIALPLLGIGLCLPRGLTLSRPGWTGACLGLAAATWAHLVIRVHCPVSGPLHALIGHLLPALPLMALGAWAMIALNRRQNAVKTIGPKSSPLA